MKDRSEAARMTVRSGAALMKGGRNGKEGSFRVKFLN
jgi:hypothetical protein